MSTEANKQVVRDFYEAGNRGDMDTCFGLIADDITWINMGSTVLSGTFRGKQDLMERLLGPLFGQMKQGIHMEIQRLIAEGDSVVAQTSGSGETLEGNAYNNRYCWIMRIRDGQIAEVIEYSDTELITDVFGAA